MLSNFDQSFNNLMQSEGGFCDVDGDTGGATNHGVTQRVWEAYTGHPITIDDMRSLTIEDVKPLYKHDYWDTVKGDELPPGADYEVFDFAVNAGVYRAITYVKRTLGLTEAGLIDDETIQAINTMGAVDFILAYTKLKAIFYESLAENPSKAKFLKGWIARDYRVATLSEFMA